MNSVRNYGGINFCKALIFICVFLTLLIPIRVGAQMDAPPDISEAVNNANKAYNDKLKALPAGYYTESLGKVNHLSTDPFDPQAWGRVFSTTKYIKTNGQVYVKFDAGTDGVGDDFKSYVGNEKGNDFAIEAWVKQPNGELKYYKNNGKNIDDFVYDIATDSKLTNGLSKTNYYSTEFDHKANIGAFGKIYSVRSDSVSIAEAQNASELGEKINELKNRLNNHSYESEDERREIESEIAALEKQRKEAINRGQAASSGSNTAFADVMKAAESGVSGVGLSACVAMIGEGVTPGGSDGGRHVSNCFAAIGNMFMEIASWLLAISTGLFDFVLQYTINDFSCYFVDDSSSVVPAECQNVVGVGDLADAVNTVWLLLKNFANLIFIGALIYIAIMTIAKGNGFGEKKLLGKVIAMAILINFSLLFTKLFIDMSNYVTTEIYAGIIKSVNNQGESTVKTNSTTVTIAEGKTLSAAFMNQMRITSIYGNQAQVVAPGSIITNSVLGTIFLLVATFVFLAGALMFLIRFLTLIILLMTSPLAYVGGLFPNAGGASSKWWSALKDSLVFAPAYMIMTYISLQLLVFVQKSVRETGTDWVAISINYSLTIACMIFTLVVAKDAGGHAGAADWGISKARGMIGKSTFGVAGWAGRGTLGKGAAAIANSKNLQSLALRGGVLGGIGKKLLNTADKGAKSSFDIRATAIGKKMDIGEVGKDVKGGYVGIVKQKAKDYKDIRKRYLSKTSAEQEAENLLKVQKVSGEEYDAGLQDHYEAQANMQLAQLAFEDNKMKLSDVDSAMAEEISDESNKLNKEISKLSSLMADPTVSPAEKVKATETIAKNESRLAEISTPEYQASRRENLQKELEQGKKDISSELESRRAKAASIAKIVETRAKRADWADSAVNKENARLGSLPRRIIGQATSLDAIKEMSDANEAARKANYLKKMGTENFVLWRGEGEMEARKAEWRDFVKETVKTKKEKEKDDRKKELKGVFEEVEKDKEKPEKDEGDEKGGDKDKK